MYQKLFSKKRELLILGILIIFLTIATKFLSYHHWESLNFQVTGYHPWLGMLVIIWGLAMCMVLYLRKVFAPSLWFMGGSMVVFGAIMHWMVNINVA